MLVGLGLCRLLIQRPAGSVCVAVIDVVDDEAFELLAIPDDRAVDKLASQGADPALSEAAGDRCSDRRFEALHAFGGEDFVERCDVLAVAISEPSASREMVTVI